MAYEGIGTIGDALVGNGAGFGATFQALGGSETLTGDTGGAVSPTAGNINVLGQPNAGSSVTFSGSGSTLSLNNTDAYNNIYVGLGSGVTANAQIKQNIGFGVDVLSSVTMGAWQNCAFGYQAMNLYQNSNAYYIFGGGNNVAFGYRALYQCAYGANHTCIGSGAGSAYTNNEINNICIGQGVTGIAAESDVTRIGGSSQTSCYITGISGVSVSNPNYVTIDTSSKQLGSSASIPALNYAITPVAFADSPYTVLVTDQFIAVDCSGGVVSLLFPDAPVTGQFWIVKDSTGSAATNNITITTVSGTDTIDGVTTYTMATNYQSITIIFDSANYEVF